MSGVDWRNTVVAPDGTHHLIDGVALYAARFAEVLKFHAPGLAPVQDASGAFHVTVDGRAAYKRRYRRAFGFYDGLAAMDAGATSWHHVGPDGEPAYDARWAWCGNFQAGRCPVRDVGGEYFHIDLIGEPLYAARWRYAGDYRDGIAVVQRGDGRSSHIDDAGAVIHGRWFRDLDVFHKSYARARDDLGWMHVDRHGAPLYEQRFAMVEPFYNGQARVERDDGGLEVIDEVGRTIVELRCARRDAMHSVSADLVSFWRCETIFAAVELGVFDGLPLASADERTTRLLDALGELGLVRRIGDAWEATPTGAHLRLDHPRSLAAAAAYWATDGRRGWTALRRAISDPAWRPADPFADVSDDPARVAAFHAALTPYAENDYAAFPPVIDGHHRSVLDAGGGTGALARAIVRARPGIHAAVLDRPEVVAIAERPSDHGAGLSFIAGDLFAPWPARADAVVLARVLHDWSDERCLAILANARAAIEPRGRLYVVELLRSPGDFGGALLSLHLLVSTGGQERTQADFERLFGLAGLRLVEVRSMASISSVLIAEVA